MNYILQDGKPVLELDLMTWAKWFETANKRVAKTVVRGFTISTVFLGLDHRLSEEGPPILWETIVHGDPVEFEILGTKMRGLRDLEMKRCSGSYEQAEKMHNTVVHEVELALG